MGYCHNLNDGSLLSHQCIKFKTDQAQDAKKMEKLNNIFFTLMAHGPEGTLFTEVFHNLDSYLPLEYVIYLLA